MELLRSLRRLRDAGELADELGSVTRQDLMTNGTVYDQHVQFYVDFVDRGLADPSDVRHKLLARFKAIVGDRLPGARVCDLACGEGYLGRFLGGLGAREVVGIDSSAELIEIARTRRDGENL